MEAKDIFFHDCVLLRVVERVDQDTLALEVEYPVEWESNTFAPKTIVFHDVLRYHVDEMPFSGPSTILEYATEPDGERTRITLRSNAGQRAFSFSRVELIDGHAAR
ncbi:MAG: hypothetical protein IPK74_16135 [Deltaproteobacteria bacterium]|nr:hypothetical protein [Deltaproteobacteria bacterium]